MKKINIENIDNKTIDAMRITRNNVMYSKRLIQKHHIYNDSPYSSAINEYISNYKEFYTYYTLKLQEATITRPALIKDIDFDLYITIEGKTNRELMENGNSPYDFDEPEGVIELHHIGQRFNGPFAELSKKEHIMYGSNAIFHTVAAESWRKDKEKEKAFVKERAEYWKKRATQEYTVSNIEFPELENKDFILPQQTQQEIIHTIETLFKECDIQDLEYLSDLAKSHALIKQTGSTTLSEFIFSTRNKDENTIICPYCNSGNFINYGFHETISERIQRYKCRWCNKTFTATSNSLISNTNFSYMDWIKFIDCIYNGYTTEKTAEVCGISTNTVHKNKIKLFYALKLLDDKVKLKGNIVVDETFTHRSFKGNHNEENFVLPRESHKRGGEVHQKGLSKEQVCVVCAMDDEGNYIAHVTGTGSPGVMDIEIGLNGYISSDEVICIYTDKSNSLKTYMDKNSYPHKRLKSEFGKKRKKKLSKDEKNTERQLQRINSFHSRLKKFINLCGGPATKYLSGYLYLFAWKERNKYREPIEAYKELLSVMTEPSSYMSVEDIIKNNLLPNAYEMESLKKSRSRFPERDNEIYDKFAAGKTMEEIGKEYGMTKQNVSLIVNKFRDSGKAYKTQKEIRAEIRMRTEAERNTPRAKATARLQKNKKLTRAVGIYNRYVEWNLPKNEFLKEIKKTKIYSKMTDEQIMRDVRFVRYLNELREEIFIHEEYSYKSLEEVYRDIYADYIQLKKDFPEMPQYKCCETIGAKYNFSDMNILRIVKIMENEQETSYFDKKRKLTHAEMLVRDKALFADFVKWPDDRHSFCFWAAEKYGITYFSVQAILYSILTADLSRYDII